MRFTRSWMLPFAVAALTAAPGLADDETPSVGTGDRSDLGGWKGLPGAKDPGEPGQAPGWIEVELKLTPADGDLPFRTPLDSQKIGKTNTGSWVDVSNGTLPLTGVKGGAMKFIALTGKIMLDLDGDGTNETQLRGEYTAAKVKRRDGSEGVHYFRLRRDGDQYIFNRACYVSGKIDDVPVIFLDENNNGHYGDSETDAMRLGNAPIAQYSSEVVNLKGNLYYLRVNQSGSKAWYKPYDGPVGKVDLASKWKGKSKPLYAMLKQGEVIIDAAARDTAVPAGTWTFFEGLVGPTIQQSAKIKPGNTKPIVVKQGETASLAWGMPGIVEFSATKNGNQLIISSSSVRIYGQGGEEYVDFRPKRFTPMCQVVDAKTKKDVMNKNMGAGC